MVNDETDDQTTPAHHVGDAALCIPWSILALPDSWSSDASYGVEDEKDGTDYRLFRVALDVYEVTPFSIERINTIYSILYIMSSFFVHGI